MIGETISHYRIVAKLGEGGMGVVYKAEDTRLRRSVALKFLRRDALDNTEYRERFVREAQAAAALDHPNVCTVFGIDRAGDQAFLVMALVEGQSVSSKIAERPLKLDEALDIAIQTAHGLQAAHEKGIVHRDIKPSNLIINQRGQLKIMDFGLAQLVDRTRLTQATSILGTVAYMSPEQANRLTTDRRSDIWSLGVVIYEMVTGRVPFEGQHEQAVIYSILNAEPEPITALRVGVPVELDRIVAKAMAKRSEQRYQHIDEMRVDLSVLRDKLVASKSPSAVATKGARAAIGRRDVIVPKDVAVRKEYGAADRQKSRLAYGLLTTFVAVLILAALIVWWRSKPSSPALATTQPTQTLSETIHTSTGDMRLIPAGQFIFGAGNDIVLPFAKPQGFQSPNPQQLVRLGAYYMDVTEVSNAAYKQFCDATRHPYPHPPDNDANYFETKPDYPVVNVSFDEAQAFARWAGKRLPTEQEWEKAARGADGRIYAWGNTLPLRAVNVEGDRDGYATAAPVNAWRENASPYGLVNMSGNVWEWTASPYQPSHEEIESLAAWSPVANQPGVAWFVVKGGSFVTPADDLDLTAFFRAGIAHLVKSPYQGFRCAMDPPGK